MGRGWKNFQVCDRKILDCLEETAVGGNVEDKVLLESSPREKRVIL